MATKKKSTRKPPAKKTRAAKPKRQPTEDFNQIAARIRRETENK